MEKKTIQQLAKTIIRGEKAIIFPLVNHSGWIADQQGHHLLDMRGWGFIQYLGDGAEELQDGIADWVVETLNKEYEKSL